MAQSLVRITLESNEYEKKLRQAKRAWDEFSRGIGFSMSKFTGMAVAIGAAIKTVNMAVGAVTSFADELKEAAAEGVRLAKAGEGIRRAFDRLNRPDLLDGLREATHNTVTDLELMKQAVKFNDFKLNLDEMGTLLAFAQQKAKDTGQSVDYMVDSIVTGLGRQSLMILDNLGLSASEIRERMKETGDMTKAVASIIKDEMKKAGDYVETAADRAAQADVKLKNAMEELGRTLQPLAEASDSLWNSMKIGALDLLNTAIKPLIEALAEAGKLGQNARASVGYQNQGGDTKVDRMISRLGDGKSAGSQAIYQAQLRKFDEYISRKRFQVSAYGDDNSAVVQKAKQRLQTELDGALKMRAEYVKRAKELQNSVPPAIEAPTATETKTTTGSGNIQRELTEEERNRQRINELIQQYVDLRSLSGNTAASKENLAKLQEEIGLLEKRNQQIALYKEQAQGRMLGGNVELPPVQNGLNFSGFNTSAPTSEEIRKMPVPEIKLKPQDKMENTKTNQTLVDGISSIAGGIQQMGIELPEGLTKTLNVMQGISSILTGIAAIVSIIQATSAIIAGTSAVKAVPIIGFLLSGGGTVKGNNVVHAADGYTVPGKYGYDAVPAMLTSGETVLNAAQTNNLASQLQGGGMSNLQLSASIQAEQIRFILNNNGRRTGRGEYVQTNFR